MPNQLPPLNSFRCFEAAARLESFSRAGDELHLTHGAISRQVRIIEAALGVRLFERRNRRVFLTDPGRNLLATVQSSFSHLSDTCEALRSRSSGPLALSCEPTLTQRWLIPRLSRLEKEMPNTVIHVLAAGGPINFERNRVDFAIRRNDFKWNPALYAELIMLEDVGPVCSPAIAKQGLEAVLKQPRIHSSTRPEAWDQWLVATKRRPLSGKELSFEHFYLSIQAAVAGLGVTIGPRPLVADDIDGGRLVAPFGFTPSGFGYYLLSQHSSAGDGRAAALLKSLKKLALATPGRKKRQKPV